MSWFKTVEGSCRRSKSFSITIEFTKKIGLVQAEIVDRAITAIRSFLEERPPITCFFRESSALANMAICGGSTFSLEGKDALSRLQLTVSGEKEDSNLWSEEKFKDFLNQLSERLAHAFNQERVCVSYDGYTWTLGAE